MRPWASENCRLSDPRLRPEREHREHQQQVRDVDDVAGGHKRQHDGERDRQQDHRENGPQGDVLFLI